MSDQQEWIDVEKPSLTTDEVTEVQDAVDQLGELESQVETTDYIAALEAYNYAFGLIQHYNQLGSSNGVSLESYSNHKSKKHHLVTSIRNQKELVKKHLTIALEAFVKNAPDEISSGVDKYNDAVSKLEKAVAEIDTDSRTNVKVDSTRVWDMFHIDGVLIEDGEEAIDKESDKLKSIVRDIKAMADAVAKGKEITVQHEHFMMFNRKLKISDQGIKIENEKVPAPKKSFSTGQIVGISIGAFLFWPVAVGYALMADKKENQAISNKDIVKLKAIATKVEKMDSYVNELCGIVNKLTDNKEINNEEKHKVITAVLVVIKQITEVTNGVAVMFANIK